MKARVAAPAAVEQKQAAVATQAPKLSKLAMRAQAARAARGSATSAASTTSTGVDDVSMMDIDHSRRSQRNPIAAAPSKLQQRMLSKASHQTNTEEAVTMPGTEPVEIDRLPQSALFNGCLDVTASAAAGSHYPSPFAATMASSSAHQVDHAQRDRLIDQVTSIVGQRHPKPP